MASCYSSLSLPSTCRRLHHNSSPFSFFFSPPRPPPRHLYRYLLFSNAAAAVAASMPLATVHPDQPLPYGPSLRRGRRLIPPKDSTAPDAKPPDQSVDEESFARVFDLAALRVPAAECSALEGRLRGHLLNWPRVRNVARVPGDDLDPEVRRMLRVADGDGGQRLAALAKRKVGHGGPSLSSEDDEEASVAPLSPVLYREKLVKEFNFRGFLKFRNLAKISRPKKNNKVNSKGGDRRIGDGKRRGVGKNDFAVVEVVGDEAELEEDLSGLLGEEFKGGRWRGPTRLLLLDEQFAGKRVEELPEAVKVAVTLL